MTRTTEILAARMDRTAKGDKGFTLIELLVVVIIIGILAAIAIPVYIGVQNNARNSATQSDLGNAKTAVVAYYTANPTAGTLTNAQLSGLTNYGFVKSNDTTSVTFGTAPTSASATFSIVGVSKGGGTFCVSNNSGVVQASSC